MVLEVLPALQGSVESLDKIYIKAPNGGGQVPLAAFARWTTVPVAPLAVNHQGQFPAVTISFNLASDVALGQATEAIGRAMRDLQVPETVVSGFQGTAQAFQQSLSTVPLLIPGGPVRGLPDPRHPLRELHPPDHHPVDAALGRRRRPGGC